MNQKNVVAKKWQRDRDNKKLIDLTLYWRLVVQPDLSKKNKIQVQKEISLWGKVSMPKSKKAGNKNPWVWRRYALKIIDMVKDKYVECPNIKVGHNSIIFDGAGFIKINDPGLEEYINKWELEGLILPYSKGTIETVQGNETSQTETYKLLGTNIRFEANIQNEKSQNYHPIFIRKSRLIDWINANTDSLIPAVSSVHSVPVTLQRPLTSPVIDPIGSSQGSVASSILPGDTIRSLLAVLTSKIYEEIRLSMHNKGKQSWLKFNLDKSFTTDSYHLTDRKAHLVTIQQDADRWKRCEHGESHYIEFYVDNIQLDEIENKNPGDTLAQHYFSIRPSDIYIGYDPDQEKNNYFKGAIQRLMFDPNASCPGCT